ncbi:hypothetical protein Bbelb_412560 [Branchiostoma belcheri]|nr:hypothetical protein Bbelb_412560 [Branchiostoma belcheri]
MTLLHSSTLMARGDDYLTASACQRLIWPPTKPRRTPTKTSMSTRKATLSEFGSGFPSSYRSGRLTPGPEVDVVIIHLITSDNRTRNEPGASDLRRLLRQKGSSAREAQNTETCQA